MYTITQENILTAGGFNPIGIQGNFAVYGPIVFIDNQMGVLIVSTVGDKVELIGNVNYPLELPGMTSSIRFVNTELLII